MYKELFKKMISYVLILAVVLSGTLSLFPTNTAIAEQVHNQDYSTQEDIIEGEIIVKLKDASISETDVKSTLSNIEVKEESKLENVVLIETQEDINTVIEELEKDPLVEYAEPNRKYYTSEGSEEKNMDLYRSEQWALDDLRAESAWISTGELSGQATVAVLDTGADYNHPDLKGRLLKGKNLAKKDGAGKDYPLDRDEMDDQGHGTFVTGIINAVKDNKIGIAGVAGYSDVKVLPIKVMNNSGFGSTYDIAEGIKYASDQNVDVINLSLSGTGYSATMAEAVEYAQDRGVLIVAAAGNSGRDARNYYPASLPGVLTVGAIDKAGSIASFSNYGDCVEVMAPGVDIISTSVSQTGNIGDDENGYYYKNKGTSFSAPYVAGISALYKLKNPNATQGEIYEAMKNSTDKGYDKSKKMNYDKVNMEKSLSSESSLNKSIKILSPQKESFVTDKVDLRVQLLKDIEDIENIEIYLNEKNSSNKLAQATVESDKEIYDFKINTTDIKDGKHELIVVAYSKDRNIKDEDSININIANNPKTGLVLEIKDPSGNIAVGSQVKLYTKEADKYTEIWSETSNSEGVVRIPNIAIDELKEYYVLVDGKFDFKDSPEGNTYFTYQRKIETPGKIEITGETTVPMKLKAIDKEGNILKNTKFYSVVSDENGSKVGVTSSLNDEKDDSPVIYMDKGKYDLFAYSSTEAATYVLNKKGQEVKEQDSEILFDGKDTGTIKVDTSETQGVSSSKLSLYNKQIREALGDSTLIKGENIFLSPGDYKYFVELGVTDDENQDWLYQLDGFDKVVNVTKGKESILKVGREINLSKYDLDINAIKNNVEKLGIDFNEQDIRYSQKDGKKVYEVPRHYRSIYFKNEFTDSFGNHLVGIYKGDTPINPSQKVAKTTDSFVAYNNSFKLFYTSFFWVANLAKNTAGEYKVELTLDKNPLMKDGINEHIINKTYDQNVKKVKVQDENGIPLRTYAWIYKLDNEDGNLHWDQSFVGWGANDGTNTFYSSLDISDRKNGNLAVFYYTNWETKKTTHIFRPFTTLDDLDDVITIDTKSLNFVSINPLDKEGNTINHINRTQNIIIEDGLEIPFNHNIDLFYKNSGVYLEDGKYGFSGHYIETKNADNKYESYYLMKRNMDISKDENVVLDGSNTAKVNIDVKSDNYKKVSGISLLPFNKYDYEYRKYDIQGNVFHIPTNIKYDDIKVVIALADLENEIYTWNYVLDKEDWKGKTFEKGEEYTLKFDSQFKANLELEKNVFDTTEGIKGKSSVSDSYGNKVSQAIVTRSPLWIMNGEDDKLSSQIYKYSKNGKLEIKAYERILEEDASIDHEEDDSKYDIRYVNPRLRIYKTDLQNEELVLDKTSEKYFNGFNEALKDVGKYRAELLISLGSDGINRTNKDEGIFEVKKTVEKVSPFNEFGIRKGVKLEDNLKRDWIELPTAMDMVLDKSWIMTFSGGITDERIDAIVIEKDNKLIPINIETIGMDKRKASPIELLEKNASYNLKMYLNNGKGYIKKFSTIK